MVATTLGGVLLVVTEHVRATAISTTVAADGAAIRSLLGDAVRPSDFAPGADASRATQVEAAITDFTEEHGLLSTVIRDLDGDVLFGPSEASALDEATLERVLRGEASVGLDEADARLTEHLPVLPARGRPIAIVSVERDATSILGAAGTASRQIMLIFGVGALVLAALLVLTFRAAQQLINSRTAELIEAARRDHLTGLLNHGAALTELVRTLESARKAGGWVVVALIDIDGFRLLNETHGYGAGDRVLRMLAATLRACAPVGALVGRGGADDFLLIGPPQAAPLVRHAVEDLREALAASPLEFPGASPLTITVSVGIASYPEHAASAPELLAVAGFMLAQARTGGGNRVRMDAPDQGGLQARWGAFGVLEGLVMAVDAKDRYTRLHSEQVSAYAELLGTQTGIDERTLTTVRQAALLHDVGKIGIPDIVLRKPGPLTADERRVIEQHAVIGDAIVSSLPGMDEVARGVRHHHERWDGTGYPDQLRGTEIPTIARILSLADAYSAMTTPRPYRDALAVDEAMAVIVREAGAQFDPALAADFVTAVRALPGGELPFGDQAATPPSAHREHGTEAA